MIPLGITEDSYPVSPDNSIFDRIGIAPEEPYFLFVGALRYYKGLRTLVKAARLVTAKIVLVGSGPEAGLLQDMARSLELKNVIFVGRVTDTEKVSLIKHCRAMVLPSHLRSEAFGVVLLEAAMLGRPMVSCEIGSGTSYVNRDAESGFVVSPDDPNALADALRKLLSDSELAARLGHGARTRYEQMFSGVALGNAYSRLYRDVVSV